MITGTMHETEDGIMYKASLNVSKYVEELMQKALKDGKLAAVVRCEECIHGRQDEDYYVVGGEVWCNEHEIICGLQDFCSYGERRSK